MSAVQAIALGAYSLLLVCGCGGSDPSPCTPAKLAAIEAQFSAQVVASCQGYTFDNCPAVPALKADRAKAEAEASCR